MTYKIVFLEPDIIHPRSNTTTVSEVADFLEAKYKILNIFTNYIKNKIIQKMIDLTIKAYNNDRNIEREKFKIQEWLKSEWRDFIVSGKTGIKTFASMKQDRVSFIDTGAYYLGMQIKIEA